MTDRITGTVKWFENQKGFGFIIPDGLGKEVYVHMASIVDHRGLRDGQRVEFNIEQGSRGPEAKVVVVIG